MTFQNMEETTKYHDSAQTDEDIVIKNKDHEYSWRLNLPFLFMYKYPNNKETLDESLKAYRMNMSNLSIMS